MFRKPDRMPMRGGAAVIGARLGLLLVCTLASGCLKQPLKEGDRRLLITAEDLAGYGATIDPVGATIVERRVRYFDGALDVDYEFEAAETSETPLYVSTSVGFERRVSDARTSYATLLEVFRLSLKITEVDMVPAPEFYSWGDDSHFARLELEGTGVGNFFLARKGRRTYLLTLSGFYFDDPDLWAELLEPRLALLESYEP